MRSHPRILSALLALSACGTGEPSTGELRVTLVNRGIDWPPIHSVLVDREFHAIHLGETLVIPDLTEGQHAVSFQGVQNHCASSFEPTSIVISPEEVFDVEVILDCVAVSGMIKVRTEFGGDRRDPDGFVVYITEPDGYFMTDASAVVADAGYLVLGPILSGQRAMWVDQLSPNCTVVDGVPKLLTVPGGRPVRDTVSVTLRVECS